jgi:hypothetical protein
LLDHLGDLSLNGRVHFHRIRPTALQSFVSSDVRCSPAITSKTGNYLRAVGIVHAETILPVSLGTLGRKKLLSSSLTLDLRGYYGAKPDEDH